MTKIGGIIALLGAILVALKYLGMDFEFLEWIDSWGTAMGWGIRVGLVVAGLLLWLLGGEKH